MTYCPLCLRDPTKEIDHLAERVLCDDCVAYLKRAKEAISKGEVEFIAVIPFDENEEE